jgi:hypothetical protein
MYWLRQNRKILFAGLIIALVVVPSVLPLLSSGFFVTDDGEWMIIRLSAFYQTFADGQAPVRFLGRLNHGYGYPVATFLYPGFMYLGSIIHLLKIGFVDTVKIILALSMVSSFIFSYFWLRKFFEKYASVVGSLFFLYTPYHLFDLYKRGSVGELAAMGVLPFVLWQLNRKSIFWSAIGIAALILFHNTLAVLYISIIVLYMTLDILLVKEKLKLIYQHAGSLFFGLGLSAFFWIPVLFELKHTVFSSTVVSNWAEYFADIDLIGYSTFLVLMLAAGLFLFKKVNFKKQEFTLLFLIVGFFSIVMAIQASSVLWSFLPVGFIQFPFRFLSLTIVCAAFVASFVASSLNGMYKKVFVVLLAVLLLQSTYQYINSIEYFDKGEGFYITNNATTTVHDEYMPVWVREKPTQSADKRVDIINGEGDISNINSDNKKVTINTDLRTNSEIQFNIIYWPGWNVLIDGKQTDLSYDNKGGLIRVDVPADSQVVELIFSETRMRLFSDFFSAISLILLIIVAVKNKQFKQI